MFKKKNPFPRFQGLRIENKHKAPLDILSGLLDHDEVNKKLFLPLPRRDFIRVRFPRSQLHL